jgi:hypothetical protein
MAAHIADLRLDSAAKTRKKEKVARAGIKRIIK